MPAKKQSSLEKIEKQQQQLQANKDARIELERGLESLVRDAIAEVEESFKAPYLKLQEATVRQQTALEDLREAESTKMAAFDETNRLMVMGQESEARTVRKRLEQAERDKEAARARVGRADKQLENSMFNESLHITSFKPRLNELNSKTDEVNVNSHLLLSQWAKEVGSSLDFNAAYNEVRKNSTRYKAEREYYARYGLEYADGSKRTVAQYIAAQNEMKEKYGRIEHAIDAIEQELLAEAA